MPSKRGNFIKEWFVSKAALQVFALCVAITAWLFVNSGKNIPELRIIKLQYVQMPQGLVFQRTPLKEAQVELEGSLYRLRSIRDEDLVYLVDLSGLRPGTHQIEIDPDALRLPLDVRVLRINPRAFDVALEEILVRNLPVHPVYVGNLKDGFSVSRVRIQPETISVAGPKSIVSKMDEVELDIPLQMRDSSFGFSLKPTINFPETQALDTLSVEVFISASRAVKELSDIPVVAEGENADMNVRISPPTAKVVVEGPEGEPRPQLRQLKVEVPTDGLKRGRYRIRGKIDVPAPYRLVSLEPENFIVEIVP